jgi:hypothetical protein
MNLLELEVCLRSYDSVLVTIDLSSCHDKRSKSSIDYSLQNMFDLYVFGEILDYLEKKHDIKVVEVTYEKIR